MEWYTQFTIVKQRKAEYNEYDSNEMNKYREKIELSESLKMKNIEKCIYNQRSIIQE